MAENPQIATEAALASMRARRIARKEDLWLQAAGRGTSLVEILGWLIVLASLGLAIARSGWESLTFFTPLLLAAGVAAGAVVRRHEALLRIVKELDEQVQELTRRAPDADPPA